MKHGAFAIRDSRSLLSRLKGPRRLARKARSARLNRRRSKSNHSEGRALGHRLGRFYLCAVLFQRVHTILE